MYQLRLQNIGVGEGERAEWISPSEEAFLPPFLDYTAADIFATPTKEDTTSVSPHIHMRPLSGKLRGVWGWVQASLSPSLCAPAPRHRHHSDKHTPTLTCGTAHCNNTHTNMHLKTHIFYMRGSSASHCLTVRQTHTHTPAYMGVSVCLCGFQVGLYRPRKHQTPAVFTENKPLWQTRRLWPKASELILYVNLHTLCTIKEITMTAWKCKLTDIIFCCGYRNTVYYVYD